MTEITPDSENHAELRQAFGRFATGVCLVTTATPSGPIGMTANSFSSVSLDPPLVLWCPAKASKRTAFFSAASHFSIHILAQDQVEIALAFARDGRAFDGIEVRAGAHGVPLIDRCSARFECATHALYEGGDHLIQVGRVLRAETGEADPLVFGPGGFGRFQPL